MAEHDDLDDLLDSALNDFRTVPVPAAQTSEKDATSVQKPSLGLGLGLGLPALGPKGKKAGSGKPKSSAKSSSSSLPSKQEDNLSTSGTSNIGGGIFSDALEELAQQTRNTLEGMGTSDSHTNGDKLVESIVKQFEELGTSEDFQSAMDTMMRQLLSKDVLHEPMREFRDKYPKWLETNKSSLTNDEFARYSKQFEYIKELCGVYETTPNDFERIVDIMQNMQACGQPPNDLVQELAPDMPLGGDEFSFLNDMLQEGGQGAGLNQNCSIM